MSLTPYYFLSCQKSPFCFDHSVEKIIVLIFPQFSVIFQNSRTMPLWFKANGPSWSVTSAREAILLGETLRELRYCRSEIRGLFLETPGNLTGPKSCFEIEFSRKVGCVLTSNEVHFVSLADIFTVQFSNLLKLLSRMKNKTA